jgi:hypothetical protein
LALQKEQADEKLQVYGNDMSFIRRQRDEAMTTQVTTEHALADLQRQYNKLAEAHGDVKLALGDMQHQRNEA